MAGFSVRVIEPDDERAVASLLPQVTDGGRVAFSPRYRVPVLQGLSGNLAGFLAQTASGAVVGAAWIRHGRCRLGGREGTYGLLNTLLVHPDHRRRGVARALTEARLTALTSYDPSAIPMAMIQLGNHGSVANAAMWSNTHSGALRVVPVPSPRRRPRVRPHPGWEVVELAPTGASAAVEELLDQASPGLAPAVETLDRWLAHEIAGQRPNHAWGLLDSHGRVLAALALQDDTVVLDLAVTRMPRSVALANRFVGVVGVDGTMRTAQARLAVARTPQAGRYLWQQVRWNWRERVTSIVTTVDPASPEHEMLAAPRWLPATAMTLAVRIPAGERLTGPIRLPL